MKTFFIWMLLKLTYTCLWTHNFERFLFCTTIKQLHIHFITIRTLFIIYIVLTIFFFISPVFVLFRSIIFVHKITWKSIYKCYVTSSSSKEERERDVWTRRHCAGSEDRCFHCFGTGTRDVCWVLQLRSIRRNSV